MKTRFKVGQLVIDPKDSYKTVEIINVIDNYRIITSLDTTHEFEWDFQGKTIEDYLIAYGSYIIPYTNLYRYIYE